MTGPLLRGLILIAVFRMTNPARADIPVTLNFWTENNNSASSLSSKAASMPEVSMSLTATLWILAEPAVGEFVAFSVDNPNLLQLSSTGEFTNANGQCRTIVSGKGASGQAKVTAYWIRWDGQLYFKEVTITLVTETATPADSPKDKDPLLSPLAIPYFDGATRFTANSSYARTKLSYPQHIGYAAAQGQIYLQIAQVTDLMNSNFGWTTNGGNTSRIIRYNIASLDGDPWGRGTDWAPLGWRSFLDFLACHELGHALLFGHNGSYTASLMWANPRTYFVWRTIGPTPSEDGPLMQWYPAP